MLGNRAAFQNPGVNIGGRHQYRQIQSAGYRDCLGKFAKSAYRYGNLFWRKKQRRGFIPFGQNQRYDYGNQGGTPGCSVRMGDYKLIEFFEDGRLELYNLRQDIGEEHNVASVQPERAKMMQATLTQWRNQVEAKTPKLNPAWQ